MKTNPLSDRVIDYVLSRKVIELSVLTVDNIAVTLKVNRSHLSRAFRQDKNFTIEEYIFKIKII
ncbi:MAG: AraC family transcriptional regulator, partial [bacterium]|nr:AraC family transcriptional regulator [bacterium]